MKAGTPGPGGTSDKATNEKGEAMVIWCLVMAISLFAIGGLSVDLWRGIAVQRALQAAAEEAATAGASGIDTTVYRSTGCLELSPSLAESMAEDELGQQPISRALTSTSISVSPDQANINVELAENVDLSLLRLVEGDRPLVVRASASSGPVGSVTGSGC